MTEFKHNPERDEEVFQLVEENLSGPFLLVAELLAIAKKWRSKAQMRAIRIEELEDEVSQLEDEAQEMEE